MVPNDLLVVDPSRPRALVPNDLLETERSEGRPEVGPSRPRATLPDDLPVGKGRPKVGPSKPRAMKSRIAVSVAGVRKSYTCSETVFESSGSPKVAPVASEH